MSKAKVVFAVLALLTAGIVRAETGSEPEASTASATTTASSATTTASPAVPATPQDEPKSNCPTPKIQHLRPTNQCGVNMFEPPKDEEEIPFSGLKTDFGAAFSQTIQTISHRNSALPNIVNGINSNQLYNLGSGFGYATANLYVNTQIADGTRLAMTLYLSSRHHQETWVKDGYVLMDKSPVNISAYNGILNNLWARFITVKAGHMEINYGDAHFRRTDNGNGVYNPFIGNYLLDAFTTEIGGEVYIRANGIMAMGGITGGEIHGDVAGPASNRRPAFVSKLGFDRQLTPNLRFRLTGSNYTIRKSGGDTLYGGDRGGSPYFFVMENTQATSNGNAFSGTINPGLSYKVTAFQVNPFVKYKGLELFGVLEHTTGNMKTETVARTWNQYAGDAVYRFADNRLFIGARYNWIKGRLANMPNDVTVNRSQFGAGWFINKYLLMKGEYVVQNYKDFLPTDIRNGGRFKGLVIAGVIAF